MIQSYNFIKLLLLFFLLSGFIHSEELLDKREAYILTESSLQEVKAHEKTAFTESKKKLKKLKKQTLKKIKSAEKYSVRYVSPNGEVFVNQLYDLTLNDLPEGDVRVSIDGGPDQSIKSEVAVYGEGYHDIAYKLFDKNGKSNLIKKENIYLDTVRPEISAHLEGVYFYNNAFPYYKKGVKLFLQAKDKESGLQDIYINLNRKGYLPMDKIDRPIDSPGPKDIKILATDKVTNISQEVYLRYTVDSEPPIVDVELNTIPESNSKYGRLCERNIAIRLSAYDIGSGVAKIEYRKRGEKTWRVYRDYALIPVKKKKISLEFRAIDNLGNESEIKYFKCKVKNENVSTLKE